MMKKRGDCWLGKRGRVICMLPLFALAVSSTYGQLSNVALNKPATMISVYDSTSPQNAVDGNKATGNIYECIHTKETNDFDFTWWRVDLQGLFEIHHVVITNRGDCCGDRLADFDVFVDRELLNSSLGSHNSSVLCRHRTDPVATDATVTLSCSEPVVGRYVTVEKYSNTPLHFCEIEVMAERVILEMTNLSCAFEDDEDLIVDCYVFPEDSTEFQWKRGISSSGPASDHTKQNETSSGSYLYADLNGRTQSEKAALSSHLLTSEYNCVTFWYYITGADRNSFSLLDIDNATGNVTTVWKHDDYGLQLWRRAQVEISGSPRRIIFEAVAQNGGFVAIDDLTVTSDRCPSSEAHDITCRFDDPSGDICDFRQSQDDDADWVWTNQETPSPGTGPSSPTSYYMYTKAPGNETTVATLLTPLFHAPFPRSCLRFRYHMKTDTQNEGNLAVDVLPDGNPPGTRVWSGTTANQTSDWIPVDITIETPLHSTIAFTTGTGDADIAIDDVILTNLECASVETLNCTGMHMCFDSMVQSTSDDAQWFLTQSNSPFGPNSDHTNGEKGGYYAYPEFNESAYGDSAALMSAPIVTDVPLSCLTFWYAMGTDTQLGTLQVISSDPDLANPRTVWSISRGLSDELIDHWSKASVTLNTSTPKRITSWANNTYSNVTMGLDDFMLTKGPCLSEISVNDSLSCSVDDEDLCGLGQVTVEDDFDWTWFQGPTPSGQTGPDGDHTTGSDYYLYTESSPPRSAGDRAVLYSPTIHPASQKTCLTFHYHMYGSDTGTLSVYVDSSDSLSLDSAQRVWTKTGNQGQQWRKAFVDMNTTQPYKFFLEGVIGDGPSGDMAIDDIEINDGECEVPMTDEWRFRCDRPTTPCVAGQGRCNSSTLFCDCDEGFFGLQCQFSAGGPGCSTNPCERGTCFNGGSCACPDNYYGDRCQHKMVYAECTLTKMVVNVLPYGFTDLSSWNIIYPETVNTSCPLQPVNGFTAYMNRGWQGFVREFLHDNDPCGGSATLVTETTTAKTYSRQLYVYFDPHGRHPTDTNITVTCDVLKLPPPHVSVTVTELGRPNRPPSPFRVMTYIQILFTLTIPNRADVSEIKVMQCTASNGVHTVPVVNNGCAVHPVGTMLYDGVRKGTEYLIMRVYKRPQSPLSLLFKCTIRLCDSRIDFSCYRRPLCFGRQERSVSLQEETLKGNLMTVEYRYTLEPENPSA